MPTAFEDGLHSGQLFADQVKTCPENIVGRVGKSAVCRHDMTGYRISHFSGPCNLFFHVSGRDQLQDKRSPRDLRNKVRIMRLPQPHA